jgi:Uma2 family endonuclease
MSRTAAVAEPPVLPMTREEYHAWVEAQPRGRFERIHGTVVARDGASGMAPERVGHARVKARIWRSLDQAIHISGAPCEALPDGITVAVGDSDYEPDAIVQCGPLDRDAIAANNPVVIVEVLSPSTSGTDRGLKLAEYFKLPSLRHYLIVWADKQQVLHHRRVDDGGIDTQIITSGAIRLDPPGLTITVEDVYV